MLLLLGQSQVSGQVASKLSTLTTDDGLGFRIVNHVTQDKNGLMWISTERGLERYDGYEFITFNDSKNANVKCPFNQSNMVIADFIHDNILLVQSNEKLFTIDLCDHSVSEFKTPKKYDGIIRIAYYSKDKKLYISVEKGNTQLLLQYENNTFKKVSEINNQSFYGSDLVEDSSNNIWVSNATFTIEKYSKSGDLIFQSKLDSFIWFESKLYLTKLFIDTTENEIYLFSKSKNEIWLFNEEKMVCHPIISNLKSPVYSAVKDDQGNIWFATKKEVFKYNKHDSEKPFHDYTTIIRESLQFTEIKNLFIDRVKVLWISTNNGIIKLPLHKQFFAKVLYNEDASWGNEMRGIAVTNGAFNFTFCENGHSGLYKINKKSFEPTLFFSVDSETAFTDGVKHLCCNKNKDLIWTLGTYLYKIDIKTNKIEKIPISIKEYTSMNYHSPVALLNDGKLIFGYHLSSIGIFHPEDNKITNLVINKSNATSIITEFYHEDRDGKIWIGTNHGLFLVDRSGKIITEINASTTPNLSNNHCLSYLADHLDRQWIGTFGGGINVITKTKGGTYTIQLLNKKSGLCDDNITGILEDDQKNIWVSTYNGISKVSKDLRTIQNFFVEDGLTNNEFNYASWMKDDEGKLWFGGLNGITIIDPNREQEQHNSPPVVLTGFSSYDRRTNEVTHIVNGLESNSKFVIDPYTGWFQFNWTLPNYSNSAKNKYYIRLEGIDNDWIFHSNNHFVRYNNLPHGKYTLHVKATDSKGNPSTGEIALPVIVLPFFYQTWWFRLLSILAIGGLIYALYKYNLNKKLAMEKMRMQIASDLHDEVGSMLSGLAMQSELLQTEPGSPYYSKMENIANLSRNVVGKMRDLVWSIDSRSDTIRDLTDKMREKMESLLIPKDIVYNLVVRDLPLDKTIPAIARQQLFLIFNEAITNVVRHSNASEVVVSLGNTKTAFEMVIRDNGTQSSKVKSTGFGLRNIFMRAAKIKANIEINKKNGYEVRLKMGKM